MIYFEDTVKCEICGEEYPPREMEKIFTGRTKYICLKCYRTGASKVDQNKYAHKIAIMKAMQNKR